MITVRRWLGIRATVNGFQVMKTCNTAQKSGAFLIALGPTALLTVFL